MKQLSSISHVHTELHFVESRKCNIYERIQLENIRNLSMTNLLPKALVVVLCSFLSMKIFTHSQTFPSIFRHNKEE